MKRMISSILLSLLPALLLITTATAQSTDAVPGDMAFPVVEKGRQAVEFPVVAAGQWSQVTTLPGAKCYHGAAWYDGAMYVFGGLGATLRFDKTCAKYDAASGTWETLAPLEENRGLPVVETVGDKIYIIGGYSATNPFTVQEPVLEYDPATNTYTEKASMILPVFGAGSFVHEGRIWVLGGGTTAFNTSTDRIQIYDPASDTWTVTSSVTPYTSWASGVTLAGTTVLYVGGARYTNGQGLFGAWAYKGSISGDNITWTAIADYPGRSTMRHAAGSDGTKAYFVGGYNAGSMNSGPPTGVSYCYDPALDSWSMKDVKPTPVYFASKLVYDGDELLYVSGGNDQPSSVTDAVEALNINTAGGPIAGVYPTARTAWVKNGDPTVESFMLWNNGSAPLTIATSVTEGNAWMVSTQDASVLEPGEHTFVKAVMNSASVGVGTYEGTITVTTNDPEHETITLTVTMNVQDEDVDTDMNVLLEEGTGTWCGFCPFGADTVKAMVEEFDGRVIAIAYHGGSDTEPMWTEHTDFWKDIVGLTGWPNGSINRMVFEGDSKAAMSRSLWRQRIGEVLENYRSPISIDVVDKSYDPVSKAISMTVEVFFHRGFEKPLRLNIAQVQNQMNYTQSFYPPEGGSTKLFPYYHDHVLRQIIPNDAGEVICTGDFIASQSAVRRTFSFTSVDSTIETSHFVIFAHLSDGNTFGEVVQSEEVALADFVTGIERMPDAAIFALLPGYPNPFTAQTTLRYDLPEAGNVTLRVYDALGRMVAVLEDGYCVAGRHVRQFNASELPAGIYTVVLRGARTQSVQQLLHVH
ncbi:Omp28-related outer membrane protein [bacterium]|nr:Omp28-related outer membrane protein [bacterium]